ncbi:MAG: hypothetical protein V1862_12070 [Methanobacteriota archaeon]
MEMIIPSVGERMRIIGLLICLCIAIVLVCGCSGPTQDEDYKVLLENVSSDFQGQKEVIVKPYQGLSADELRRYKSAALSAQAAAESMTLSDKYSKSRGILVQGMNATITAIDTLEQARKLSGSDEKIPTESVNLYFITSQNKINDACDLIGLPREKTF